MTRTGTWKYPLLTNCMLMIIMMTACTTGGTVRGGTGPGNNPPAESTVETQPIFDLPFEPQVDGFSFRNYSYGYPEGDLTIEEVRQVFGDNVCVSVSGDTCAPTPAAQNWIDTINGYMTGGRCAGFTGLSYRLFDSQLQQSDFTSQARTTFDITQQVPAMRAIARNYIYQILEEVWKKTVSGTPSKVLDALIKLAAPADLGIFSPDNGGHSMVAYGVDQVEKDLYWIHVYDSNWPGADTHVVVDTAKNTWRYSMNGLDPADDPDAWTGDSKSKTLMFIPLAAYDQVVSCPFCSVGKTTGRVAGMASPKLPAELPASMEVFINAVGDLLITDPDGLHLGTIGGELVTEIPGSAMIPMRGSLFSNFSFGSFPQPDPVGNGGFSMSFMGDPSDGAAADWRVFGQGFGFSVENLDLAGGVNDQFTFDPATGLYQMSFTTSELQNPVLKMYYQDGENTYFAGVGDLDLLPGSTVNLRMDDTGLISFSGQGFSDSSISIFIVHISPSGISIFSSNEIHLPMGGSIGVSFNMWTEGGQVDFLLDLDNDGNYEDYSYLYNLPLEYLMKDLDQDEIIAMLSGLAPYMTGDEIQGMLDILLQGYFSPSEIGAILNAFLSNGLQLDLDELAGFILKLPVNPGGMAELIFSLHLSEEDLQELYGLLGLSPEEQALLMEYLGELQAEKAQWVEDLFNNVTHAIANFNLPGDQGGLLTPTPTATFPMEILTPDNWTSYFTSTPEWFPTIPQEIPTIQWP